VQITTFELAILFATLFSPLIAVQVQKLIERLSERRNRQDWVFRTIMTTRATPLSLEHVRALNMVPLEFRGHKNKVVRAWKVFFDHLNSHLDPDPSGERYGAWVRKKEDLLVLLLVAMANQLGYDFNEVELKREFYNPVAHGTQEQNQLTIQQRLADILSGKDALPMKVTSLPSDAGLVAQQMEINEKLLRCLDGQVAVKVKVEKEHD
jgi:hypothetical protein